MKDYGIDILPNNHKTCVFSNDFRVNVYEKELDAYFNLKDDTIKLLANMVDDKVIGYKKGVKMSKGHLSVEPGIVYHTYESVNDQPQTPPTKNVTSNGNYTKNIDEKYYKSYIFVENRNE